MLITKTSRTFFNSAVCFFPLIYILACIVVIFVILSMSFYFSSQSIYFLCCSRESWGSSRLRTHSELSSVFFIYKSPSESIPVLIHYFIKYWLSGFLDLQHAVHKWTYNCLQIEVWLIQLMFSPYKIYPIRLSLSSGVFWLVEQSQAQMCRKPSCILPCRKKAINQEHFKAVAMVRALYPIWYISDHDLWDRGLQCFS